MRIAEVADRTGTPSRLLRYYEEQGLLAPARNSSGYRDYSEHDVEVARRIRRLLDAGLSTATIRIVLPCLAERAGRLAPVCSDTVDDLKREQARIEASIEALTASRDAISAVITGGEWAGA
ncbi:MerR family transcriptional regulator [Streptomonospora sediminis]